MEHGKHLKLHKSQQFYRSKTFFKKEKLNFQIQSSISDFSQNEYNMDTFLENETDTFISRLFFFNGGKTN